MTEEEKQHNRLRIGEQISEIRKWKGYTIKELSELCGVTCQNINKIEKGKYNVGIDVLCKISKALEVEIKIE